MQSGRKSFSLSTRRQFLKTSTGAALGTFTIGAFSLPVLAQSTAIHLDVHKEPSCGCCVIWIEHMEKQGFATTVHHPDDLNALKAELGILPEWQSCHTAVTANGHLFEGHVPARYISSFLAAPPENALGLAVPGMPIGSPGMEMGERFTAYDVILMKKDGRSEVYASIKSAADQ